MVQNVQVPVVYQDLRPEENILQIVDALEWISKVVDDVFSNISNRVSEEKSRIESVSNRVDSAANQIEKIRGSTKPTVVYSPAKYPDLPFSYYTPVHHDENKNDFKHSRYHLRDVPMNPVEGFQSAGDDLVSYSSEYNYTVNDQVQGLGRLPNNPKSVSSLLLFNSRDNPYKTYVNLDNLAGQDMLSDDESEENEGGLTEAPRTVTEGDTLPEAAVVEFLYKPVLEDVPEFNFPAALDLPNLADIHFDTAIEGSTNIIAPSAALTDLPSFSDAAMPVTQGQSAPPTSSVPTPPPEAPSGPPPEPSTPSQPSNNNNDSSSESEEAPSGGGGRGDLLAAIRKGKQLKKVDSEDSDDESAPLKAPAPAAGGDMFSDLINALNRRRIGINSGKSKPEDKKSESGNEEKEEDIKAPSPALLRIAEQSDDEGDIESDNEEWED